MTLDEAIKWQEDCVRNFEHLKEIRAVTQEEIYCNTMHKQLADWLKELKQTRCVIEDIKAEIKSHGIIMQISNGEKIIGENVYIAKEIILEIIDKHISGKENT